MSGLPRMFRGKPDRRALALLAAVALLLAGAAWTVAIFFTMDAPRPAAPAPAPAD